MHLLEFCKWLQHTSVGTAVSESLWLFPLIETIHIWGIILLVGTTGVLDLRLLGFVLTGQRVSELHKRLIRWTWVGFGVMFTTGGFMFASEAAKMYENGAFRFKMILILLAGLNALVFETTAFRHVANWDDAPRAPIGAKVAACVSLVAWVGVIAAGRWIAYW
ncbi:MAG TPA: DUF6644 family protein [Candidatus Acidoferrales bacterium]|nr:DUF6644 family protein [Candidatus Acidoferrales bacterium]